MSRGTRGELVGVGRGESDLASVGRGQSDVVGVALMLAVTLVALGTLTASIGAVVQQQAAGADATRVADGFEDALQPVEATGVHRGEVSFTEGTLTTEPRTMRVLDGGRVVATVDVGALVYRNGRRRVAFVAGAVVRGTGNRARFAARPPLTLGEDTIVVGAAALNVSTSSYTASGATTVTLRTNVTHDRATLGRGNWRIAVETATPHAWTLYFREAGATVSTRDFDGDGVGSVVASFPDRRFAYFVVHSMHLEVAGDG